MKEALTTSSSSGAALHNTDTNKPLVGGDKQRDKDAERNKERERERKEGGSGKHKEKKEKKKHKDKVIFNYSFFILVEKFRYC